MDSDKVAPGLIYACCCQRYYDTYGAMFLKSGRVRHNNVEVFTDGNKNVGEAERTGYCMQRMRMLPELVQKHGSALLLDVDSFFRKQVRIEPEFSIGVFIRPDNKKTIHRSLGGAVYVTRDAMHFAETLAKAASEPNLIWGDDQRIIYEAYMALEDKSKVKVFDRSFIDWQYPTKAPIYTAKGAAKEHPRFIEITTQWSRVAEGHAVQC